MKTLRNYKKRIKTIGGQFAIEKNKLQEIFCISAKKKPLQKGIFLRNNSFHTHFKKFILFYGKCKDQIWLEPQNRNGSRPTKSVQ